MPSIRTRRSDAPSLSHHPDDERDEAASARGEDGEQSIDRSLRDGRIRSLRPAFTVDEAVDRQRGEDRDDRLHRRQRYRDRGGAGMPFDSLDDDAARARAGDESSPRGGVLSCFTHPHSCSTKTVCSSSVLPVHARRRCSSRRSAKVRRTSRAIASCSHEPNVAEQCRCLTSVVPAFEVVMGEGAHQEVSLFRRFVQR